MLLEIDKINVFYGTSHILFDLDVCIDDQEVVCLLGRNGAGKTTTMQSIMGLTPPKSGSIRFEGKEIGKKPSFSIVHLGIGYVPDTRRVFTNLTVSENLKVAMTKAKEKRERWTIERIFTLFPKLRELENRKGKYLSGGEQQMLTIGRALMTAPKLLLLDEPSQGLSPLVIKFLGEQIIEMKREGLTILLSEQNIKFATELSDRAYVIEKGVIRYQGTMEELMLNQEVKERYLMV
jgi:branched-chain amino acid transport system ATP-binding protein